MNQCVFSGKIFNMKDNGKKKDDCQVRFRLGVRKSYVSDKDKKDGKTLTFISCVVWGNRAEFVKQYFNDGDFIEVAGEYETFEGDNGDVPQIRLSTVNFPVGGSSKKDDDDDDRSSRRNSRNKDKDKDEDDDDRSSRRSRRRKEDDEDEDDAPRRRSRRQRNNDDDDDQPF